MLSMDWETDSNEKPKKETPLKRFTKRSISRDLTFSLIFTIFLVSSVAITINSYYTFKRGRQLLQAKADEYIQLLSHNLALPLWNIEYDSIQQIGSSFFQNEVIVSITIQNPEGKFLFQKRKPNDGYETITRNKNIMLTDEVIGSVSIDLTTKFYAELNYRALLLSMLVTIIIIMTLVTVTGILLRVFLKKPLNQLTEIAYSYSTGKYSSNGKSPSLEFLPVVKILVEMGNKIKEQLEALQQAELKYRGIFENAVEGIFQTLHEGRIISANPAMARMLGYDTADELISTVIDLGSQLYVNPEDRKRFIEIASKYNEVRNFETQFYKKDGSIFWISLSARTVRDSFGDIMFFEGTLMDITERIERERAEKELKEAEKQSQQLKTEMHAREVLIQKKFIDAFIRSIATAIDEKSPYTGGHVKRVVSLTMMIAKKINEINEGPFADVYLTDNEIEEIRLAAWMHDIGKITTPEYVVDKATKLQTIFDRIHLVETRLRLAGALKQIDYLKRKIEILSKGKTTDILDIIDSELEQKLKELDDDIKFLKSCNDTSSYMGDEKIRHLYEIGKKSIMSSDDVLQYLTDDEIMNLSIRKGSLNTAERKIIENHSMMTLKLLKQLPFPEELARVAEFAGGHHEKLDGSGYPKGLVGNEIPLQSRIIAISDIFEALTAKDRPYREPMRLSQALRVLNAMKNDYHIDPDIYDLFIDSKLYLEYAKVELSPDQFDLDDDFLS